MVVLDFSLAQSPFYFCCFRLLTFLVDETQLLKVGCKLQTKHEQRCCSSVESFLTVPLVFDHKW